MKQKVKKMNLSDENNIREIIHEVSSLTNKPISKTKEIELVKIIQKNGINQDLLNMI
mgnify:CR=1 FL=1